MQDGSSSSCPSDDADERPTNSSSDLPSSEEPEAHCSYGPRLRSLRSHTLPSNSQVTSATTTTPKQKSKPHQSSKSKKIKLHYPEIGISNLSIELSVTIGTNTDPLPFTYTHSLSQCTYDLRSRKNTTTQTQLLPHIRITASSTTIKSEPENEEEMTVERNLFRRPATPFEIPYLLNKILDYLPLEDWKSCRLVNKQWQTLSVPQVKKFRLNIKDGSSVLSLMTSKDQWVSYRDNVIYTNIELPVTISLKNDSLNSFLETYGRFIKSLVINNNGWSIEDLQMVLFNKCCNLEELKLIGDVPTDSDKRVLDGKDVTTKLFKLKRLVLHFTNAQEKALPMIHLQGYYNSGTNIWTKRLIADLLFVSPNLEFVRCSNKRDMNSNPILCNKIAMQVNRTPDEVEASLSRVNQFLAQKLFSRSHDATPKLVDLDLYLRLNDRGMEKLEMKKYPLQALDLHVRFFDKISLVSLLKSLGGTLKHLRLRVDRLLMLDFSFVFFTELESLHLEDYAGNLIFLGDMPKLKTVILDRFDCKKFAKKENLPCFLNSKVTSLTFDNLRPIEKQGKCIKKIAVMLPNIKEFSLNSAKDSDLVRIFDSMPQLEHLKLNSEAITSSGISGFIDADMENILDSGYELSEYESYEKMRRLPYIGDLKNLKTLSLHGDFKNLTPACMTNRMPSNMHGMWVLHGICNLKKLTKLSVQNTHLSSLELKQIVTKMNLIRLELKDCKVDAPMEQWVRKKTFGRPFQFIFSTTNTNNNNPISI